MYGEPCKNGCFFKSPVWGLSMKQTLGLKYLIASRVLITNFTSLFNLHGTGLLPNAIFSARGWSPNHKKVFNRIIFVFPLKYVTGVKNDVGKYDGRTCLAIIIFRRHAWRIWHQGFDDHLGELLDKNHRYYIYLSLPIYLSIYLTIYLSIYLSKIYLYSMRIYKLQNVYDIHVKI